MKKKPKKEAKLEYLQDPNEIGKNDPDIIKPLYKAEQRLHEFLEPENLKKEARDFINTGKKVIKKVRKK